MLNGFRQTVSQRLLRCVRLVFGERLILAMFRPLGQVFGTTSVLRALGASVGEHSSIHSDVRIYNTANEGLSSLTIGSHVYIGPRCIFDLSNPILIADFASIAADVGFITHMDVGPGPLKSAIPRRDGSITVGRGAFLGARTTILHGVQIGECSVVGAMSLVTSSVAPGVVAFGCPCRTYRTIDTPLQS